ncbi:hypothetical protein B4113_0785 [Geobacillus sp. B4113_201601]|nr:hypothetical protein B4113_0785 [Geobacillus sp. B4113_201601]
MNGHDATDSRKMSFEEASRTDVTEPSGLLFTAIFASG